MNKKTSIKGFYILPILLLFVAIVLTAFGSNLLTTPDSPYYDQLETGWSVSRGDQVYTDVSLSNFSLGKASKGEVITISTTVPRKLLISPTIMFKSSLSAVSVKIDGEEVYSFGQEFIEKGKFVPKKYNMITLTDETKDHVIDISFTLGENNAFRKFISYFCFLK